MKRIISLILCLVLLISLTSCKKISEILNDSDIDTDDSFFTVSDEKTLEKDENPSLSSDTSDDISSNDPDESKGSASDDTSSDTSSDTSNEGSDESDDEAPSVDPDDEDDKTDEDEVSDGDDEKEDGKDESSAPDDGNDDEKEDEPQPCKHANTKIVNKKDATTSSTGYTGDKVCSDCGALIEKGETIDKLKENTKYITYTNAYGDKITVTEDVDVFQYTLAQANKTATSDNPDVEAEILRLTNIEREKAGLQPLKNETGAYYFAKLRAEECHQLFSHTRPNGQGFHTVFCDEKVFYVYAGENLAKCSGYEYSDYASVCVEGWMNSEGHRANILNPKFTSIAIATVVIGNTQCSVQLFFGKP